MSTPPDTIRKLKALIDHPNTSEAERHQARRLFEKLLRKHGYTEAEISSDHIAWLQWTAKNQAHLDLILRVIWEVTGSMYHASPHETRLRKTDKRGQWSLSIPFTIADACDFRACMGWYEEMLEDELSRGRRNLKDVRKEAQASIERTKSVLKAIPAAFLDKYKIGNAAIEDEIAKRRQSGKTEINTAAAKKPTKEQLRKAEKEYDGYLEARDGLQDGDRWQKGAAEVGTGAKVLGNGDDIFTLAND